MSEKYTQFDAKNINKILIDQYHLIGQKLGLFIKQDIGNGNFFYKHPILIDGLAIIIDYFNQQRFEKGRNSNNIGTLRDMYVLYIDICIEKLHTTYSIDNEDKNNYLHQFKKAQNQLLNLGNTDINAVEIPSADTLLLPKRWIDGKNDILSGNFGIDPHHYEDFPFDTTIMTNFSSLSATLLENKKDNFQFFGELVIKLGSNISNKQKSDLLDFIILTKLTDEIKQELLDTISSENSNYKDFIYMLFDVYVGDSLSVGSNKDIASNTSRIGIAKYKEQLIKTSQVNITLDMLIPLNTSLRPEGYADIKKYIEYGGDLKSYTRS